MSENGDDFVSDFTKCFFYSKHPNIVLGSYNHSALEANQLVEDGLEKDSYNQSRIKKHQPLRAKMDDDLNSMPNMKPPNL